MADPKTRSELKAAGYRIDTALARCRSCQADIFWAKTPKGRNQPFDPPDQAGHMIPHHATCPDAKDWKRYTPEQVAIMNKENDELIDNYLNRIQQLEQQVKEHDIVNQAYVRNMDALMEENKELGKENAEAKALVEDYIKLVDGFTKQDERLRGKLEQCEEENEILTRQIAQLLSE